MLVTPALTSAQGNNRAYVELFGPTDGIDEAYVAEMLDAYRTICCFVQPTIPYDTQFLTPARLQMMVGGDTGEKVPTFAELTLDALERAKGPTVMILVTRDDMPCEEYDEYLEVLDCCARGVTPEGERREPVFVVVWPMGRNLLSWVAVQKHVQGRGTMRSNFLLADNYHCKFDARVDDVLSSWLELMQL